MKVLILSLVGAMAAAALLTAQQTPSPTPAPEGGAAHPLKQGVAQTGRPAQSLGEAAARIKLPKLTQSQIKEMFSTAAIVPASEVGQPAAETKNLGSHETATPSASAATSRSPGLGKADYGLKLETLSGTPFDARALQGKVVLLNFWATWCGPCRAEMPSIQRFYDDASSRSVTVLALSDEKPEAIAAFLKKNPYSFPIYRIVGKRPAVYSSTGIPVTFILTPDGRIASKHVGSRGWADGSIVASLKTMSHV
ncbi:MAG: TlpA disulfide reductase family protein [Thermoanaerobaculales bacterium]